MTELKETHTKLPGQSLQEDNTSGGFSRPVFLSVLTSLVVVVFLLIRPAFREQGRENDTFPFLHTDGIWSDSVFNTFTFHDKLLQLFVYQHDTLPILRSQNPLPEIHLSDTLMESSDSTAFPDTEGLLSLRNDSLVKQYMLLQMDHALMQESEMLTYPLWSERQHLDECPDTLYLQRQIKLIHWFTKESMTRGLIPVIPLPKQALRLYLTDALDSVVFDLHQKIIHALTPAILIDSIPDHLSANEGMSVFLNKNYGFQGLIVIQQTAPTKKGLIKALNTGADMLMISGNTPPLDDQTVVDISADNQLFARVNHAARRVLWFKEWIRKQQNRPEPENMRFASELNITRLNIDLSSHTIIRVHDSSNRVPLHNYLETNFTIHIPVGEDYQLFLKTFGLFSDYTLRTYGGDGRIKPVSKGVNIVLADSRRTRWKQELQGLKKTPTNRSEIILIHTGKIAELKELVRFSSLLHTSNFHGYTQRAMANFLFGGIRSDGVLPWDLTRELRGGLGLESDSTIRLNYTIPEATGIDSRLFMPIDSIIHEAIINTTFPGCQVFVAWKGNVIYQKSFGETTYKEGLPVTNDHLYDLASVTKVAATTLAMMKMYEEGKMKLDDPIGKYFQEPFPSEPLSVRQNNLQIKDIPIKRLLTHQSGLPPGIPLERFIFPTDRRAIRNPFSEYYSRVNIPDTAEIEVAADLYLFNNYTDTLWMLMRSQPVDPRQEYVYGDINMVWLQMAIDTLNRVGLDQFVREFFYQPMGLRSITYNPLKEFPPERIVPTTEDLRWRNQLLHGHVHDPTSALLGGVAGNAGLFSNAGDLGIIFQMLLNGGTYGGHRFLKPETVSEFVARQKGSHRGLGFDLKSGERSIAAPSASMFTYGHLGFTGTCVWTDPVNDLVYIFLSNRVHPSADNQKINIFKVRQKVHQVIYDAIEASGQINSSRDVKTQSRQS